MNLSSVPTASSQYCRHVLAIASMKRLPLLPDVPTLNETVMHAWV